MPRGTSSAEGRSCDRSRRAGGPRAAGGTRRRGLLGPARRPATASTQASAASPVRHAPAPPAPTGRNTTRTRRGPASPPGCPRPARSRTAWNAHLDGAVYGQPLVVGDEVIAATENDSVYALNRVTGKTIWRTNVGTAGAAVGAARVRQHLPARHHRHPRLRRGQRPGLRRRRGHRLPPHAGRARRGHRRACRLRRDLDSPTSREPARLQPAAPGAGDRRRAGLRRVRRAVRRLRRLPGRRRQRAAHRQRAAGPAGAPRRAGRAPSGRTGGPVVGPDGDLWVSVGNGAAESGAAYDGSDSVTELSPALQRVAYFAPSTWADDNANDLDLGSTQPVLAAGDTVFIVGKRGIGYLLTPRSPAGSAASSPSRTSATPSARRRSAGPRCTSRAGHGGLAAVEVSAASKTIKVLWRGPSGTNGSPVVGGGAVWVTNYSRQQRRHAVRAQPGNGPGRAADRDQPGPAALLVAVAERRQRLRQHADRRHRDQRRLAGGRRERRAGPRWLSSPVPNEFVYRPAPARLGRQCAREVEPRSRSG